MLRIKRVPVSNQSQKGKYIFPSHPFSKQTYCHGQSFNSLSSWLNCSELSKGGAINHERLTEVWVTEITKSERKKTKIGVNIMDMVELCQCFERKSIFGWATWEIHATTFTSSFSLYQSDLTALGICQWCLIVTDSTSSHDFNTSSSSENIKILLRPSGGEFIILLLANFPRSEHTLFTGMTYCTFQHINTSTCVQEKHTGNVYCTNLLNNPHVDKQTQKNTMHYK